MSVVVTWLRNLDDRKEELTTTLLDFIELPCSHSAKNMAEALAKTLKEYGIDGKVSKNIIENENKANVPKVISITCDNASANTAMFPALVPKLPNFRGKKAHVRCFSHSVNLTAKGVLRPFEPVKSTEKAPDNLQVGFDELNAELEKIEESEDDTEGFVEVLEEMSDKEREEWERNVKPVRTALFKVCCHVCCHVTSIT